MLLLTSQSTVNPAVDVMLQSDRVLQQAHSTMASLNRRPCEEPYSRPSGFLSPAQASQTAAVPAAGSLEIANTLALLRSAVCELVFTNHAVDATSSMAASQVVPVFSGLGNDVSVWLTGIEVMGDEAG